MANTTFKGPVRSQNGFQELVDGVWTPLGGGGGGSVVVLPVDTASYVLPGDATPGQVITIVRGVDEGTPGTLSITAPIPSGGGGYRFIGMTLYPGMGGPTQIVDNALLEVNTATPYQFTFVYCGMSSILEATWSITGYGVISNI